MNFGYMRVSTAEQNPDRQRIKLLSLDIDERHIFMDAASGKSFARTEYQSMKRMLREGDVIFIDALDRLGRNYDAVVQEWLDITRNIGADIVILEQEALLDSRRYRDMGDMGKLIETTVLNLLSYIADLERQKIRSRQREGIDAAKKKGKHLGRPYKRPISDDWEQIIEQWRDGQITAVQAMKLSGLGKTTFYRRVKEKAATTEE